MANGWLPEIAEAADGLTEPSTHVEFMRAANGHKRHRRARFIPLPSLLDQLREMFEPGPHGDADEGGSHGRREPPVPVNLDAVSAHAWISTGAVRWLWSLRVEIRDNTASCIRALVGEAPSLDSDTQMALLTEIRSWRHLAQVITGERVRPFAPHVECPHCGRSGGLRVRLDTSTATCLRCGAGWTPETIGVLAAHVESMTEA